MKIIFLSRLYHPHVGGVEKHVEEISKILSTKHQVTIVTEQHDPDLPLYEVRPEAAIYRIPVSGISEKAKKWIVWQWFWHHRQLMGESDIIHAHDVFFWVLPFRFLYPFKKYFITFHGYEGAALPGQRQILWHKIGEWFTGGNICIGDFHHKWYGTRSTIVSYGAVTLNTGNRGPKTTKAVFIGRLAADTGLMDYLVAAKTLKVSLDVFGDGPLKAPAQEFAKKNHLSVNFFGFVPEAANRLPKYSVAFVSRYLGILETLSAQVPVIAHYDSAIKQDYLQLAPFAKFIDICGGPSKIVAAYIHTRRSPQRTQKRILQGYNWVKGQTWPVLAGQYEQLWRLKNPPLKSP